VTARPPATTSRNTSSRAWRTGRSSSPAVVNLSLGTGLGPHDGTTDFELALDALTGAGKIIVASAGNGQADLAHASRSISSAAAFNFTVPTYTPLLGSGNDAVVLDLWHAAASVYQVRVQRPTGPTLVGPVSKGSSASYSTVDGNIVIDYTNSNDPNGNGQAEIAVEINDVMGTAPRAGAWQIQLTPVGTPAAPLVHAWTESYIGSSGAAAYFSANVDTTVNVSSPATASNVIAVAAYTSKRYWASVDGSIYYFTGAVDPYQICAFSARGPRRDGVLKPEIAAPGSAIVSVLSGDASPPYGDPLIAPDGVHLAQQGTSMSAPHVTGAAAMLLQSTPTLTPASLKAQLAGAARSSAYMGTVPNARWGAGKLDVGSLLCSDIAAPVVAVTHPQSGNTLYTGTLISLNWTATDDYGVTAVDLEYHVGAAGAWTPIATGVPNNNGYFEWTVPGVITDQMQIRVTAHDCIGTAVALSPFVPVRAPSVGVPSDLPLAFAAYRSTPNPFSSAATLRFDLPAAPDGQWPVDVSIFNVAGRRVRTVVKSDLPPGRYSYEWDGRSDSGAPVSAGIYFLRISAGENEARQRLIYLR
jgi:hypothetical protein